MFCLNRRRLQRRPHDATNFTDRNSTELAYQMEIAPRVRAKYTPVVINARDKAPGDRLVLWSERIHYRVHSSPCAFHSAVRDVLRCNHRALRHVSCGADRPRLNTASANGEREND